MSTRFILYGNSGRETDLARKILDSTGVHYRFEAGEDSLEPPTLMTPAGRFRGLDVIRGIFQGAQRADSDT